MRVPFRSVLCPTDLTPLGNLAVGAAFRLAADGATVHLLHVDEPPKRGNPLYPDDAPKDAPSEAEVARAREECRRALAALVPPDAAARGVRAALDLVEAPDVALAVEKEAKDRGAEVVVLSSHGRWGVARALHGDSVATRLLHRRDLDVIVVHSDRP
jgi:nucleotide-binding universal stress UspA family protein